MNGADLIAHILKLEGVEILPAFPHSDLIEAAAKVQHSAPYRSSGTPRTPHG